MRKKLVTIAGLFTLMLAGCANNNLWVKPGASAAEFTQARYTCLQQSQQGSSSAYVNRSYGVASSGAVTNDAIFTACMNASGWNLQNAEVAQASQQQQQSQIAKGQAKLDQIGQEIKAACSNPEYQIYFAKSPCSTNEITLSQMSDKTKITAAEKVVLEKALSKTDKLIKEGQAIMQSGGSQKDKEMVNYMQTLQTPAAEKNRLDLFDGKITWGEYNRKRKEINEAYQSAKRRIYGT